MSASRGTSPAFQVYAFDLMAKRDYRLMTLAERGLLFSMLCECWANIDLPASPDELATLLGKPDAEQALTNRVKKFFIESDGLLRSPDIEAYRCEVLDARKRRSEGGKIGGKKSAEKRKLASSYPSGSPSIADNTTLKDRESESENESEHENESIKKGVQSQSNTAWVNDYELASKGY